MKLQITLFIILLFSITNLIAQEEDIEAKLKNASKEEKLEILNQLVDENYISNPTKCIGYAVELQKISKN